MEKPKSSIIPYIFMAVSCGLLAVIILVAGLFAVQYFDIDINENLWLFAIPVILAVLLNVLFIELYDKRKKK